MMIRRAVEGELVMAAPQEIVQLADLFQRDLDAYHSQHYNEDAIKVGGATQAPDYCFRIGGARNQADRGMRPPDRPRPLPR